MEEHSSQSKPSDPTGREDLRQNDGANEPTGSSQSHASSPFTEQYYVGAKPSPSHVITAYDTHGPTPGGQFDSSAPIMAEVVHHPGGRSPQRRRWPPQRAVMWPLFLFVATCFTTYAANGPLYAAAVMFILTAHEFGHFFQTLRCKIHASYPMFIPMPFPPLGTMGAVIGMAPHEGNRRDLFDVAVSGPIAGLIPALVCCVWGLQLSEVVPIAATPAGSSLYLGEPLLFKWISYYTFGAIPEGFDVRLHPIAFAGWVGLLITALNLFPIGQLDGGHTLYALLGKKAHGVARAIWIGCLVYMVLAQNWGWSLMLALVWFMGTAHPPTADDTVPLGMGRKILGWALLMFLPIGFTPTPFIFPEMENPQQQQEQKEEIQVVQSNLNHALQPAERQTDKLLATDHNLSDHRTDKQQRDTTNQHQNLQGHQITHQEIEPNWKCGRHSLPENQLAGLRQPLTSNCLEAWPLNSMTYFFSHR